MRDGYRNDCKACNLAARAARYAADPQKYIDRTVAWRDANKERALEYWERYRNRPDRKRAERNSYLKRKYGITLKDFERMLEEQGGVCKVCKEQRPNEQTLHVDHDHETGEVRGLLCFRCNNAIGDLRDDPDLVQELHDYLDRDPELDDLARERARALTR
jgi:hypothetical protein